MPSHSRFAFVLLSFVLAARCGGTELQLPGAPTDVVVAGNGKYLLAKIAQIDVCSIIDIEAERVVKQIPLPSSGALIAGSRQHLVVVDPDKLLIQRYVLGTWKLEVSAAIPWDQKVSSVALGSASNGPLLLASGSSHQGDWQAVDLQTLQPLNLDRSQGQRAFDMGGGSVRASANGRTFGGRRTSGSPTGIYSLRISGNSATVSYDHDSSAHVIPDHSGAFIYSGGARLNASLQQSSESSRNTNSILWYPAADCDWSFRVLGSPPPTGGRGGSFGSVQVVPPPGTDAPEFSLAVNVPFPENVYSQRVGSQPLEKRFHLFLRLGRFVTLNDSSDVKISQFKFQTELKRSGKPYLIVVSSPDAAVKAGATFAYQLTALSSVAKFEATLEAGPAGMVLTSGQRLVWQAPRDARSAEIPVILRLTNSAGCSLYHTFALHVDGAGNGRSIDSAQPITANTPRTPTKISGAGIDVTFPSPVSSITVAGAGRYLLAHLPDLRQIAVVDLELRQVVRFLTIPSGSLSIAGSRSKIFVLSIADNVIHRFDLATFKRETSTLVPNDVKASALACGHASDGPLLVVAASNTGLRGHPGLLLDADTFQMLNADRILSLGHSSSFSADGKLVATILGGVITWPVPLPENVSKGLQSSGSVHHISLNHNGSIIYTSSGSYSSQGKPLHANPADRKWSLASITGSLVMNFSGGAVPTPHTDPTSTSIDILLQGDDRILHTFSDLPPISSSVFRGAGTIPPDKRLFLSADHGVLAVLPRSDDRLHLRPFNMLERLNEKGIDYLLVDSLPPASVRSGESMRYEPRILSKRGGVEVTLEAAPKGMKLEGKTLTWDVPNDAETQESPVVLTISDASRQKIYHSFRLSVVGREAPPTEVPVRSHTPSAPAAVGMPKPPQVDASSSRKPEAANGFRVWKDEDGAFELRAELIGVTNRKTAELRTETGRIVSVPLNKLSPQDIYYCVEFDLASRAADVKE